LKAQLERLTHLSGDANNLASDLCPSRYLQRHTADSSYKRDVLAKAIVFDKSNWSTVLREPRSEQVIRSLLLIVGKLNLALLSSLTVCRAVITAGVCLAPSVLSSLPLSIHVAQFLGMKLLHV